MLGTQAWPVTSHGACILVVTAKSILHDLTLPSHESLRGRYCDPHVIDKETGLENWRNVQKQKTHPCNAFLIILLSCLWIFGMEMDVCKKKEAGN